MSDLSFFVPGKAAAQVASGPRTLFEVPQTTIPVVGSEMRFPVRRIYCIGRNYAARVRDDHALFVDAFRSGSIGGVSAAD